VTYIKYFFIQMLFVHMIFVWKLHGGYHDQHRGNEAFECWQPLPYYSMLVWPSGSN